MDKGVPDKVIQLLQSVQHAMQSCVQRKIFDRNDVVIKVNANLKNANLSNVNKSSHSQTLIEKIEDTLFRIQNIDLLKLLLRNNDIQRYMRDFERLSMYEPKVVRTESTNKTDVSVFFTILFTYLCLHFKCSAINIFVLPTFRHIVFQLTTTYLF